MKEIKKQNKPVVFPFVFRSFRRLKQHGRLWERDHAPRGWKSACQQRSTQRMGEQTGTQKKEVEGAGGSRFSGLEFAIQILKEII